MASTRPESGPSVTCSDPPLVVAAPPGAFSTPNVPTNRTPSGTKPTVGIVSVRADPLRLIATTAAAEPVLRP